MVLGEQKIHMQKTDTWPDPHLTQKEFKTIKYFNVRPKTLKGSVEDLKIWYTR